MVDAQLSPSLTLSPAALTGVHSIVEGLVLQLHCTAESISTTTPPTITWTKDSVEITDDLPHVRLSDGGSAVPISSSVLTIDGFVSGDDGRYQCVGSDSSGSAAGEVAQLRGSYAVD